MTLCDGWISFDFLCSSASFLTLSVMSIERYKMLTTSYVHIRHSSKMRIIFFIMLSWLLPCISWIPTVLSHRFLNASGSSATNSDMCSLLANKYLILVLCVLLYHIPLVCMVTFYTKLIVHIKRSLATNLESAADHVNMSFSSANNNNNNNGNIYSSHYPAHNNANNWKRYGQHKQLDQHMNNQTCYSNSMSDTSPRHIACNLSQKQQQRVVNQRAVRSQPNNETLRTKRPAMVKSNSMNINYINVMGMSRKHQQQQQQLAVDNTTPGLIPKIYQLMSCCVTEESKAPLSSKPTRNRTLSSRLSNKACRAEHNSKMYAQSVYNNNKNSVKLAAKSALHNNNNNNNNTSSRSSCANTKKNSLADLDFDMMMSDNENNNNSMLAGSKNFDASKVNYFMDEGVLVTAAATAGAAATANANVDDQAAARGSPSNPHRFSASLSKKKDSMLDANDFKGLRYKRNRKAARMLGLLVAAFSFCWLPFAIGYPLSQFFPNLLPSQANLVIWWLGYINSTINPFLYVYSNKNIRYALHFIFSIICPILTF
jgi:hypothetical protein